MTITFYILFFLFLFWVAPAVPLPSGTWSGNNKDDHDKP